MKTNYCKLNIVALATLVVMIFTLAPMNVMADDGAANDNNGDKYVMMNVPYSDFYGEQVDSVTSATKKKTMNERLVAGSYHTPDGGEIRGVTCPVKLGKDVDLSKYKKVNSEADLFAGEDYTYMEIGDKPSFYLEVSNEQGNLKFDIATAVQKATKKVSPDVGEVITDDHHVDYAIKLKNSETFLLENTKVYGVTLKGYGSNYSKIIMHLTQLRNIFVKNQLGGSKEDLAAFVGGTIESIIYYTSDGIYEISNIRLQVPMLVNNKDGEALKVEDIAHGTGSSKVTVNLPEHYMAEYFLDGVEIQIDNGRIVTKNLTVGTHKLTAKDRFKKFSNIDAFFTVTTEKMPAKYDGAKAIKKNNDATDDEFKMYINNITKIQVKVGNKIKTYGVTGRHGVPIIDKNNGELDFESEKVARLKADFPDLSNAEITIMSAGYKNLSFNLKKSQAGNDSKVGSGTTHGTNNDSQNTDAKNTGDKQNIDKAELTKINGQNAKNGNAVRTGDDTTLMSLVGLIAFAATAYVVYRRNLHLK